MIDYIYSGFLTLLGIVIVTLFLTTTDITSPKPKAYVLGYWSDEEKNLVTEKYLEAARQLRLCRVFRLEYPHKYRYLKQVLGQGIYIYSLGDILGVGGLDDTLARATVGGSIVEVDLQAIILSPNDTITHTLSHELLHIAGFTHSPNMEYIEEQCAK